MANINGIANANIIWFWEFNTESGYILTDGDFPETAGAASFNILYFHVRNSQFSSNIGATYIESQPIKLI